MVDARPEARSRPSNILTNAVTLPPPATGSPLLAPPPAVGSTLLRESDPDALPRVLLRLPPSCLSFLTPAGSRILRAKLTAKSSGKKRSVEPY
jgi:hypothetical protein